MNESKNERTLMNVQYIVDRLVESHGMSRGRAMELIDAILLAITDADVAGEEVSLSGFGKFKVSDRPARKGRNPANGQPIETAASRKVAFSPAKQLKDRVQAGR